MAGLAKQRARNPEDKLARREEILAAATRLLERAPLASVTMVEVARASRLAKGTLYLYFRTKEELLLAVFERSLASLFADLAAEVAVTGANRPASFARAIVTCVGRQPVFTALAAVLHTTLEYHVDRGTAVRFKRELLAQLTRAGELAERHLSLVPPGHGRPLLVRAYALLIGIHQLAAPAPVMADALAEPDLEPLRVDFASELYESLVLLLRGTERYVSEVSP
jgi:AcrR family transcriptional regulator